MPVLNAYTHIIYIYIYKFNPPDPYQPSPRLFRHHLQSLAVVSQVSKPSVFTVVSPLHRFLPLLILFIYSCDVKTI